MSIPTSEQETVICFGRNDTEVTVWTSDSTVMTKLDKKVNDQNSPWELSDETTTIDGDVTKTYKAPKKLISFRKTITTRELTEEQKQEAVERMRNLRNKEGD